MHFWFGGTWEAPQTVPDRMGFWFRASPGTDAAIRERFSRIMAQAAAGELGAWRQTPEGALALILLWDQFPRNLHRGTAAAFARDAAALKLCLALLDSGGERALPPVGRVFVYMPLQHAEDLALQDRGVAAYEALLRERGQEEKALWEPFLGSAREHRAIVARFGRFPHRNTALGRAPTEAEIAYLEGGGKTFGQ